MRKPQHKHSCARFDCYAAAWSAEELRAAGCIAIYRAAADLFARYNDSPLSGV
jgi:hypothetical protein